jgi:2-(1,2-epoxy-1,2-dihydrophenyl)acetyl-CoA isomerase
MEYENFDCEVRDGCARLSLIGPGDPALSALCDEFTDLMLRLQEDRAVRVVLLIDGDHSFDYHTHLDNLTDAREQGQGFDLVAAEDEIVRRMVTLVHELVKPVVAATRGDIRDAGLGLYLAADVRLAASSATFTAADLGTGLLPGWGLLHTLPRIIGPGRTLDFLWSGRTLPAAEAASIGLVDRIIGNQAWDQEIDDYCDRLRNLPQPAVRLTKLGAQQSGNLARTTMLAYEWESQRQCWDSVETTEGLRALREMRAPQLGVPANRPTEDQED